MHKKYLFFIGILFPCLIFSQGMDDDDFRYIFGYGIQASPLYRRNRMRIRSRESKNVMPVRVSGVRMGWYSVYKNRKGKEICPEVAVKFSSDHYAVGVLYKVPKETIKKLDKQQAKGIFNKKKRYMLPKDSIVSLNKNKEVPDKNIWIYLGPEVDSKPTEELPILQSYVDEVLAAYQRYGKRFVQEFIYRTDLWGHHWDNDRDDPKYKSGRGSFSEERRKKFKLYLKEVMGKIIRKET